MHLWFLEKASEEVSKTDCYNLAVQGFNLGLLICILLVVLIVIELLRGW